MPLFRTACPRNCYSSCSFLARTDNGRLTGIEPDPENRATAGGPCLKGLSYIERQYANDRLIYPMARNRRGGFDRITWEEALGEIAGRLTEVRERHGPHAIFFYESSGMAGLTNGVGSNFWKMFGGATTTYGNLCWPAGLEAVRLTLGDNRHNAPWDLENSRLILLWGKNPAETNIHQVVFIEKAMAKGTKVVVVDPRRTPTGDFAHLLLQPKPGTDAALALGIANHLIRNDLYDKAFVERHVNGFDRFRDSVAEWNLEKAAAVCDIPLALVEELAGDIAGIFPMTLIPGYGMQRFSNGGQTIRALLTLSILTGNIGKPGATFHYANLQSFIFDKIKEPLSYYPGIEPNPLFRRTVSKARLGEGMLAATAPPLKFMWTERGNPVAQNPDSTLTIRAMQQLDFRVTVDQFLTDTARASDIVLPAKSMFEQDDITGSYWHPYVLFRPKLLTPPGEVYNETRIYRELAGFLGYSTDEIDRHLPPADDEGMRSHLQRMAGEVIPAGTELFGGLPLIPDGSEEVAYASLHFPTPSGKVELCSEAAAALWKVDSAPSYTPLTTSPEQGEFHLLTPNTKNRIHSQFGNLSLIRQFDPEPHATLAAADAIALGVRPGDRIRLHNDQGSLETKAEVDFSLRQGCVVYCNGYQNLEGGSPNRLTTGLETDMGYGTAFHDTIVKVTKL